MNEQNKKQVIFAGVLGAVLIGVLVYQFVLPKGNTPASQSGSAKAGGEAGSKSAGKSGKEKMGDLPTLETVDIDLDELIASVTVEPIDYTTVAITRDPMEPLVGKVVIPQSGTPGEQGGLSDGGAPAAAAGLMKPGAMMDAYSKQVTGIIWDAQKPMAVVDDEVVGVGHVFANGIKVHAIEPTRVVLQVGDSLVPVEMKEL